LSVVTTQDHGLFNSRAAAQRGHHRRNHTANLAVSVEFLPSPRRITFEYTRGWSLSVHGQDSFDIFSKVSTVVDGGQRLQREKRYTEPWPAISIPARSPSNSEAACGTGQKMRSLERRPGYYQTYWFRCRASRSCLRNARRAYKLRIRQLSRSWSSTCVWNERRRRAENAHRAGCTIRCCKVSRTVLRFQDADETFPRRPDEASEDTRERHRSAAEAITGGPGMPCRGCVRSTSR